MVEFKRISFSLLCYKKKEKIALSHNNGSHIDKILFDYKKLGFGLCDLVNHKHLILQLANDILSNIGKYLQYESIEDNIQSIFNEFKKISLYLIFAQNNFVRCMYDITEEIEKGNSDNLNNIYIKHLNKVLKNIIGNINLAIAYKNYKINAFHVPNARVTCNINKEKNFSIRYTYVINTLEQFITVSYYQLKLNKLYFMQCAYHNCNKYFIASRGQERFCTNPCPDNPEKSCRSIHRKHEYNNEKLSEWEKELDKLELVYNRLKERFRYEKQKRTNNKEKESIDKNREMFKKYVHNLKSLIRGATRKEKRKQYLKMYEIFLYSVEEQIKTQKTFRIKKPM